MGDMMYREIRMYVLLVNDAWHYPVLSETVIINQVEFSMVIIPLLLRRPGQCLPKDGLK